MNQKTLQTLKSHQDFVSTTSFCLFLRHLQFVWISRNSKKSYRKIVKMAEILQRNIFTFGTAKTKCQQQARVFQLIWIDWNLIKMLKKVWFEKAWELTFHSHLKLVSLVKKSMKSCFFPFFWKNAFTLDQISQTFW